MRLRKLVLITLLVIETLCSSIYFLGYTESGLHFCLSMFDKWRPGALKIKHTSGNLMSGFQLENLSYHHQNQNITISHLELYWQPYALFRKKILIKKLVVEDAKLNLPVSHGTKQTAALPSFITIKEFIFKKIAVQYGDARLTINGSLTDKWNTIWQLTISDIHEFLSSYTGSLSASGNIAGPLLHPEINVNALADKFKGPDILINKIQSHININLKSNAHSKISLSSDEIIWKNNSLKKFKLSGDGTLLQLRQFLFNWKG